MLYNMLLGNSSHNVCHFSLMYTFIFLFRSVQGIFRGVKTKSRTSLPQISTFSLPLIPVLLLLCLEDNWSLRCCSLVCGLLYTCTYCSWWMPGEVLKKLNLHVKALLFQHLYSKFVLSLLDSPYAPKPLISDVTQKCIVMLQGQNQ